MTFGSCAASLVRFVRFGRPWFAPSAAAVAAFVVVTTASVDAHAFCRTMTKAAPADYDAVSNGGCFSEGVPLFWRNSCLGYSLQQDGSRKISYEDATNLISTGFTRWTGATCPTDGTGRSRTSIDVRDLGPVECGTVGYESGVPNQNVVVFRDDSWAHGPQVLGLTTVSYDRTTGEIYAADMEINTLDMQPLALRDPVPRDAYDFLSVVTHEAGHFLGIGHSDDPEATMFARYDQGSTEMRALTDDDVQAICTVYRPDGRRAVLEGQVTAAPQCDPTPRGGFSTKCESAAKCNTGAGPGTSGGAASATAALTLLAMVAARRVRRPHAREAGR